MVIPHPCNWDWDFPRRVNTPTNLETSGLCSMVRNMLVLPLSGPCLPQHGPHELMGIQGVTDAAVMSALGGHFLGPDKSSNQKSELYSTECESLQHQRLHVPGTPPTLKYECGVLLSEPMSFLFYRLLECLICSIELATFQSLPRTLNPTDCFSTQWLSYDQHYLWSMFKGKLIALYPIPWPCGVL